MTDFERLREMLEPKLGGWLSAARIDDLVRYQLEQGVIVPPCKVGDTVYLIMAAYSILDTSTYFAEPIEGVVDCISYCGERGNEIDIRLNSNFGGEIVYRTFENYKKSFFLDRKEAVAALQDILGEEAEQAQRSERKNDFA